MIFRAADVQGAGQIKADDFRIFLQNLNLNMSESAINLLIKIFD